MDFTRFGFIFKLGPRFFVIKDVHFVEYVLFGFLCQRLDCLFERIFYLKVKGKLSTCYISEQPMKELGWYFFSIWTSDYPIMNP